MENEKYGVWCGKDATVAVIEDFSMAYLRVKSDVVVCVFRHDVHGTLGVVRGLGVNTDAHAEYEIKNPDSGRIHRSMSADNLIKNHSGDSYTVGVGGDMVYVMYDGTRFELTLAESIDMAAYGKKSPPTGKLSVAERMAKWNVIKYCDYGDGYIDADVNTERYSILFSVYANSGGYIYCRVGQNGYCEKGWAMISPTCVRQNECRMVNDNTRTLGEYKPDEACFVEGGCAFPADGGWYWSLKEATDDVIYLNGCGGATYQINRPK